LIIWLLVAAIPAALTKEGYRPNRAGSFLGLWSVISAFGLWFLYTKFTLSKKILLLVLPLIVISYVYYLEDYALAAPIRFPNSLSYGYRDLVTYISSQNIDPNSVIVDRGNQSQTYFAFYQQINPKLFQQDASTWWSKYQEKPVLYLDMLDGYHLNGYTFKTVSPSDFETPDIYIVTFANKYLNHPRLNPVHTIYYPDRTPVFVIYKTISKQGD